MIDDMKKKFKMTQDKHEAKCWRLFKKAIQESFGKGTGSDDEILSMISKIIEETENLIDSEEK